jgi:ribonuclease BN (tRNA processing enzyme)
MIPQLTDIDNFLITHSHADHVGGLEEAQLAGRYVKKRKPTMIITQAYEKILWEQSLRGGAEASEAIPLKFNDLWNIVRPRKLKTFRRDTYETDFGGSTLSYFGQSTSLTQPLPGAPRLGAAAF